MKNVVVRWVEHGDQTEWNKMNDRSAQRLLDAVGTEEVITVSYNYKRSYQPEQTRIAKIRMDCVRMVSVGAPHEC